MGEGYSLDVVSIRLVKDAPIMSDHRLAGAEDVATLMGGVLRDLDREVVCVINMKADGTPINCNFAGMGTVNRSLACPRELFKSSILSNAAMMMLVHNHPSGNLSPSKEDINLTGCTSQQKLDTLIVFFDIQSVITVQPNRFPCTVLVSDIPVSMPAVPR